MGNLHTLNASHTNITDVSMLNGLNKLDITYTKVTDVSMLKQEKTLMVSGTIDTSMLNYKVYKI
jgi:ABC-type sulfate transport system substrate-binding protein